MNKNCYSKYLKLQKKFHTFETQENQSSSLGISIRKFKKVRTTTYSN